jgi:hypothetical protein
MQATSSFPPSSFPVARLIGTLLVSLTWLACSSSEDESDDPRGSSTSNMSSARSVGGFDLKGPRTTQVPEASQHCPDRVDAVADACRAAHGTSTRVKDCQTLCSVPIAPPGKVAGFDFDGFQVRGESDPDSTCPELVDAVAETCRTSLGVATPTADCTTLCSVPIAQRGEVSGFEFSKLQTKDALPDGTECPDPEVVDALKDACRLSRGKAILAKDCLVLCTVPFSR